MRGEPRHLRETVTGEPLLVWPQMLPPFINSSLPVKKEEGVCACVCVCVEGESPFGSLLALRGLRKPRGGAEFKAFL